MTLSENNFAKSSMDVLYSISFYSPIIIIIGIILFSIFTSSLGKAFVYLIWIFIITFIRIIVFKGIGDDGNEDMPSICTTGLTQIFIPKDVTYSTYLMTFTLMYFFLPMIMISKQSNTNAINYGVLAFFIAYIVLDLFIKTSLSCIPTFFSKLVIGNIVSGLLLGGIISGIFMYGTNLKSYLFINEINNNKEVCSMPSKQQFKCAVYKNGELVGSTIN